MTERHERSFAPSLQLFSLSDLADGLEIDLKAIKTTSVGLSANSESLDAC